jgi:hypothetical protein
MIARLFPITTAAPTKPPLLGGVDARPEDFAMTHDPFHSRRTSAR